MIRNPLPASILGSVLLAAANIGTHAHNYPTRPIIPLGSTPDEMRDMIRMSLETWGPVVEAAKIWSTDGMH